MIKSKKVDGARNNTITYRILKKSQNLDKSTKILLNVTSIKKDTFEKYIYQLFNLFRLNRNHEYNINSLDDQY
ncbi:hypothetical protein BpHYR1_050826 [Brachionus plicatilis]|uniref:Uncharacterized protein n=1 Tax=Brachionus plicatilis TaxID=10195 RepID=A0A3M7T843_BRAPC|nr:hypothetical protein BpHYR1_050826 [Brachionus plicatilis]